MRVRTTLPTLVGLLQFVEHGPRADAEAMARRPLTAAQACALARSMSSRPSRLPPLICETQPLTKSSAVLHPQQFFAYQLVAPDTEGGGSLNRGFYAVNRVTGDTWELVLCQHVSSAAVRQTQARLRRSSGLSTNAWNRAARERPCEAV